MIFIKKGWKKYPVIHPPISKLYLIEILNKYPKGFYLKEGNKLRFYKDSVNYKKFDIKIDFFNSMKLLGMILSVYYFFVVKKSIKKKVSGRSEKNEEFWNGLKEEIKKKGQIKNDPFGTTEEE